MVREGELMGERWGGYVRGGICEGRVRYRRSGWGREVGREGNGEGEGR